MDGIEIGIKVIVNIYLHVEGNEIESAFDHDRIVRVYEDDNDGGSLIEYSETGGEYSSKMVSNYYRVAERKSDIEEAIKKAREYKLACLKAVDSKVGG